MPMQKVPIEFSEWRPDVATLDTKFASEVENVFAGINSYLPCPSLLPFAASSEAVPFQADAFQNNAFQVEPVELGPWCGLYSARTSDGTWKIYGGTRTALYVWSLAGWSNISRTVGGDYNVAENDLWVFEQSGTKLVAVNSNDDPQVVDIDSGSNFAALGGSPPKAGHVRQIGDFLFLSALADTPPWTSRTIIWSSINDITGWTIGLNLCDMQEFPDNGPVMGIAGAEIGYVVQDRGIRTMQFLPGDTNFIFNFSRVLHDRGSISKYGFTAIGNVLYFVSEDGFYAIAGQQVTPIGSDKVNEWWLAHTDADRRNVVQAIAGVNKPRVVWACHSTSASHVYDLEMIFDWSNQRWTRAAIHAQVWALLASPGLDLDTDGPEPGDPLLDSAAFGLDSFAYVGGRPLIGAINEDGYLSALTGPNMLATMETAEVHLAPGQRAFVSDVYPLDDAVDGPGTVAAGTRERLADAVVFGAPMPIEITGSSAVYSSARLHRFRRSIPPGAVWTHAQGVLIETQQDGSVA